LSGKNMPKRKPKTRKMTVGGMPVRYKANMRKKNALKVLAAKRQLSSKRRSDKLIRTKPIDENTGSTRYTGWIARRSGARIESEVLTSEGKLRKRRRRNKQ
jgi:hypothetical protein